MFVFSKTTRFSFQTVLNLYNYKKKIFSIKHYFLSSPATPGDIRQAAAPPRPETAWERGLRQAKEMKRLSQQRKETDVEYEEKRTAMSLTQAELVSKLCAC
jgi:hypothetical protein